MAKKKQISRDTIAERIEDALFLDPPETFDAAIIGTAERAAGMLVVAYDRKLCIKGLMKSGMDEEEAEEFFSFNTAGAWVGDMTPVFVDMEWERK